jgi:hypothetical protein
MLNPKGHARRFPSVIDSTMIAALSCSRRFDASYIQNYTPDGGKSIHLTAGAAFARGLEVQRLAYYQGYFDRDVYTSVTDDATGVVTSQVTGTEHCVIESPDDCLTLGIEALMLAYGVEPEHSTAKTLDRMCGALEFYSSVFPLDDATFGTIATIGDKPGIEWNFCLPLPVAHPETGMPLLYCGRLDVILDIYGGCYQVDDKTTSSLGQSWPNQWDMRGQFASYAWGARELGIKVDGTLVRGISILKTKYDSAQAIVHQPDWKIDEWLEGTCRKLEIAKRHYLEGISIPAFGEPCNEYGGCEFKTPCMVRDHQAWMEMNYAERNWNPLERH